MIESVEKMAKKGAEFVTFALDTLMKKPVWIIALIGVVVLKDAKLKVGKILNAKV